MKFKKLPTWISAYTILLGIFALGMAIWTFLAPKGMIEVAGLTLEGTGVSLITGLFAARNAAFGILFLLTFFVFRTKEALLTIYISRLALDILDTGVMFSMGMLGLSEILQQVVFLIPVSIVIYHLLKHK